MRYLQFGDRGHGKKESAHYRELFENTFINSPFPRAGLGCSDYKERISWGLCRRKAPESFLFLVDILVGSNQHTGQEGHEFGEADHSIFISIQLLEYFVNGSLIFGVLEGA